MIELTRQQRYMERKRAEGRVSVTVLLDKRDARKLVKVMKHGVIETQAEGMRYALDCWHHMIGGGTK